MGMVPVFFLLGAQLYLKMKWTIFCNSLRTVYQQPTTTLTLYGAVAPFPSLVFWAISIANTFKRVLNLRFLPGETAEWPELQGFLRAAIRTVLDGKIGRTRPIAVKCIEATFATLEAAGDDMSVTHTGLPLNQAINLNWLETNLESVDKKNDAKLIFNAMLLPPAPHSGGSPAQVFTPVVFGRKAVEYHIDHLIPSSMAQGRAPGSREINSLRNYAPLPSNDNRVAKATSCSAKLAPNGIYQNYVNTSARPHPYCGWLIGSQGFHAAQLDVQRNLEPNSSPDIGDERLAQIASELRLRL